MPRLPELADLQNQAKDLAATPEPGQSGPADYEGAAGDGELYLRP